MRLAGISYAHRLSAATRSARRAHGEQELYTSAHLSVAETSFLIACPNSALGLIDRATLREDARQAMPRSVAGHRPVTQLVVELGIGHHQMVEIRAQPDRQ